MCWSAHEELKPACSWWVLAGTGHYDDARAAASFEPKWWRSTVRTMERSTFAQHTSSSEISLPEVLEGADSVLHSGSGGTGKDGAWAR